MHRVLKESLDSADFVFCPKEYAKPSQHKQHFPHHFEAPGRQEEHFFEGSEVVPVGQDVRELYHGLNQTRRAENLEEDVHHCCRCCPSLRWDPAVDQNGKGDHHHDAVACVKCDAIGCIYFTVRCRSSYCR